MRRIHRGLAAALGAAALLLAGWPGGALTPTTGWAQTASATDKPARDMPDNARAGSYGGKWECKRGFRERDGGCVATEVPENAFATDRSYGTGWECRRGFRLVDKTACEAIPVPENAYLDAPGDGWKCNRGYRATATGCEAILVPENGYFVDSPSGRGWRCERGFYASGEVCKPVTLPENAHLDYSGNAWECDRPYRRLQDRCALP